MTDRADLTALEGSGTEDGRWWIADHGAQVMAWQPSFAQHPVIWSAPDDLWEVEEDDQDGGVVRGGIPVCFPWFGTGGTPHHGIGRRQNWERTEDEWSEDGSTLTVEHWLLNADVEATQTTVMAPDRLELRLRVTNNGATPRRVELAHHSYWAVGDVEQASIIGLGSTGYWDAVRDRVAVLPDGPLKVAPDTDFVIDAAGPIRIDDPAWGRSLIIEREGSPQVVVWNPRPAGDPALGVTNDRWREFVCIESAVIRDHALQLQPGASHELLTRVRVAPR